MTFNGRLSCILILTVVMMTSGCSDVLESKMNRYQETRSLIDQGWLPSWLPPSVVYVREAHNLDTNGVIAHFRVGSQDPWLPDICRPASLEEYKEPWVKARWWPKNLSELAGRVGLYRCSETELLVFSSGGKEAFYWSVPIVDQ